MKYVIHCYVVCVQSVSCCICCIWYIQELWERSTPEVIDLLLQSGVDIDARDDFGKSALMWAVETDNVAGVQALLAAKVTLSHSLTHSLTLSIDNHLSYTYNSSPLGVGY